MDLRKSLRRTLPLAALALVAVLGVAGGRAARAATAADTPVVLTITDASFTVPAQLPAGFTSFTVANTGTAPHEASFFKFNPGVTLDQVLAVAGAANDASSFLALGDYGTFYGGPTNIDPGTSVTAGLNLTAGTYGIADTNNFDTIAPVTITVTGTATSAAPAADMTIRQREFAFDAPATVKAGSTRIAVSNAGSQVHEMQLVKLDPGKTLDDIKAALSDPNVQGPPDWVHPTTSWDPQSTKVAGQVTVTLTAGTYALLCFMPDTATLTPHAMLGMASTLTVQ